MDPDDQFMDDTNNILSSHDVKLMSYQKSPSKEHPNDLVAPLAEEEGPPTPPPPLPPLPLAMSLPPRPKDMHSPTRGHEDHEPSENTTFSKHQDESLLVKESSRPKPVRMVIHAASSLYAKLLVAATAVLVTTEILPNSVPLFFYHGYLFTFLLGGAILCILGIYLSLCLQKCPGVEEIEGYDDEDIGDKKYSRRKKRGPADISVFFRVGALVFGLGTLIAIGLETATLVMSRDKPCVDKLNFVQPMLHALFTFLQMHFLSLNSKNAIQNLGWCRHIILMHLVATNIAVWLRLVVWETAKNWLDQTHSFTNSTDRWPPAGHNMSVHAVFSDGRHAVFVSPNCRWVESEGDKMEDLLVLRQCYQSTTIGLLWEKAQPFILPFIIQYCLVGAVVNYVLWNEFSNKRRRITRMLTSWTPRRPESIEDNCNEDRKVDCKGSSKGLFLGLLVLAVGIVVLILFFVLTNNENLKEETLFIMITVHSSILSLSALGIVFGICRVANMCTEYRTGSSLHTVLQNIGVTAVLIQGMCSIVVGATNLANNRFLVLLVDGSLMIFQSLVQSILFHKVGQKCCSSKCKHQRSRPGRQIVTFLAFTNLVLWITESFTDHDHVTSQLQLQFFGVIPWGLVSRVLLPLVIFYRFHSSIYLMEAWKFGYNDLH